MILQSKGFVGLNATARDFAQSAKDGLVNDADFTRRYNAGEPAAIAQLYKADILLAQSSGNLTDRAPNAATDYDALKRTVGENVSDAAAYDTYAGELSSLASGLEIPPSNAATLAADHFAAIKATNGMTNEERSQWGENQARDFAMALGNDPDATIKSANAILSSKAGKSLDLNKIVRSNGASVATILLFQAQSLQLNHKG